MNHELSDKVALVTGASRGIGKAIAIALAMYGAHVAVNFRTRRKEAEDVQSRIESMGRRCVLAQADVSSSAEVLRITQTVKKELGPVSILINNAGVAKSEPSEEITEQSWDETLACNLKSQFLLIQATLPDMRKQRWGRIINLSSIAAQTGGLVGAHYAASKAGILGLTHFYANSLAKEGITVNAIAPALIETDMIKGIPKATPSMVPVGRFGLAEEVAQTVILLVSNGYVTGQTINVNGGLYMS